MTLTTAWRCLEGLAARWPLPTWATCVFVLIGLAAFAYVPLLNNDFIISGDSSHAFRTYQMHRCLADGQWPCRWVPDLGNGYGYPLFNYYPPLPYYVGAVLRELGISYLRAVNLLFAMGLIGAGLSMFALTRRLWGDLGGLVSALAYVFAPYLALDVFLRGALDELWALAVAPALLWALLELITTARLRCVPLAALFGAMLLLSHNLVAVIMVPAVVLWVVVLLTLRGRDARRPALMLAVAGAWALGLAAFFTLPVLREGDYVQLDSLARGQNVYSDHFASVSDLFFLRTADYSYLFGGRADTPLQIGWYHWGFAALAVPAALLLLRARRYREALAILMFAAFFGIGVYMTGSVSSGVWGQFDSLRFLQFPWRYLGLVSLAAAALAGAWFAVLRGQSILMQAGLAIVLAGILVGSGSAFFHAEYRCHLVDSEVLSGKSAVVHTDPICDPTTTHPEAAALLDYLPKVVEVVPGPPDAPSHVMAGSARIVSARSGTDWLRLRIEAETDARIEASIFDFPNWRVRVDGKPVPHVASDLYGLITFNISPGTHDVELRLEDTRGRRVGNLVSLVSWSAFAGALLAMLVALPMRRFGNRTVSSAAESERSPEGE